MSRKRAKELVSGERMRYWWVKHAPAEDAFKTRNGYLLHVPSGRLIVLPTKDIKRRVTQLFLGITNNPVYMKPVVPPVPSALPPPSKRVSPLITLAAEGAAFEDYVAFKKLIYQSRQRRWQEHLQKTGRETGFPKVPVEGEFKVVDGFPPPTTPCDLVVGKGLLRLIFDIFNSQRSINRLNERFTLKFQPTPNDPDIEQLRTLKYRIAMKKLFDRLNTAMTKHEAMLATISEYNQGYDTYTLGDLYRDRPECALVDFSLAEPE